MNPLDEKLTREFAHSLTYTGVNTCHLSIEVRGGFVKIGKTVPTMEQGRLLFLAGNGRRGLSGHLCRVVVLGSTHLVVSTGALTVRMAHHAGGAADRIETLHFGVTALQG